MSDTNNTNDWFRLPETGDGTEGNSIRPDFLGHGAEIDGWSGQKSHPDGGAKWVVRVYGDAAALEALASEPKAQRLDNIPVQALNKMVGGEDRDAAGWRRGMRIGGR